MIIPINESFFFFLILNQLQSLPISVDLQLIHAVLILLISYFTCEAIH